MNHRLRLIVLLLGLLPALALAGPDETLEIQRRAYEPALRWENFDGAPHHVSGVMPEYDWDASCHLVTLDPGEETLLRLPKNASLRLRRYDGELNTADVQTAWSNGNGVYLEIAPSRSEDGRELLYQPTRNAVSWCRIGRPGDHDTRISFALYFGVTERNPVISPYRQMVGTGLESVPLRRKDQNASILFGKLHADTPVSIPTEGPTRRWKLLLRVPYAEAEPDPQISLQLDISHGDEPPNRIIIETGPESYEPLFADGAGIPVSREIRHFITVPSDAESVTLQVDRLVYVRILEQEQPDFLLPALNEPRVTSREAILQLDPNGIDAIRSRWMDVARTTPWSGSGLAAYLELRKLAEEFPHFPELADDAEDVRTLYTFWQNLTPNQPVPLREHPILSQTPVPALPVNHVPILYRDHRPHYSDMTPSAMFASIAPGESAEMDYILPDRGLPSLVRLVMTRPPNGVTAHLKLRVDGGPSREVFIHGRPEAGALESHPGVLRRSVAARYDLKEESGHDAYSLAGFLGAPALPVGTVEWLLPDHVRKVSISRLDSSSGPIRIALQVRTAKSGIASEGLYLSLLDDAPTPTRALELFAEKLLNPDLDPTNDWERRLFGAWTPLHRLLIARRNMVARSVVPPEQVSPSDVLSEEKLSAAKRAAHELSGSPLLALHAWGSIARQSDGETRHDAELSQADLLLELGEYYLAETRLRGLLLYGANARIREAAYSRLSHIAEDRADENLALAAATCVFRRDDAGAGLARIIDQLIRDGRYRNAIECRLLLPQDTQDAARMAVLAGAIDWQQTRELYASRLPADERLILQGRIAAFHGNDRSAMDAFQQAGATGASRAEHLERGRALARRMLNALDEDPATLLTAWAEWSYEQEGPHSWTTQDAAVRSGASRVGVNVLEQDLRYNSFHLARGAVAENILVGPASVRLQIRPVHPNEDSVLHGEVIIQSDDRKRVIVVGGNVPSGGLRFDPSIEGIPGRSEQLVFELGPGLHAFTVASESFDLIYDVETYQSRLPMNLLPHPSAANLGMLIGRDKPAFSRYTDWTYRLLDPKADPDIRVIPVPSPIPAHRDIATLSESVRQQLKAPATSEAPWRSVNDSDGSDSTPWELAQQHSEDSRDRLLRKLVGIAESRPELKMEAVAAGAFHMTGSLPTASEDRLWTSLRADTGWEWIQAVDGSAGIRKLPIEGWAPESPFLQVRSALLPKLAADQALLSNAGRLETALNLATPAAFRIRLKLVIPAYLPRGPVRLAVGHGDEIQSVVLSQERPEEKIELSLPAGRNRLWVQMQEYSANHYVQLLLERVEDGHAEPLPRESERSWQVATTDEPVVLKISGPAWLRIDRLSDSQVTHEHRVFGPGSHLLELKPDNDDGEVLYRLHRRVAAARPELAEIVIQEPKMVVPPPPIRVQVEEPEDPGNLRPRFEDSMDLGDQEDGTWSLALRQGERRQTFEEGLGSRDRENFLELRATHRYRYEDELIWLRTRFLNRIREDGGNTSGVQEEVYMRAPSGLFGYLLQGHLYGQRPDEDEISPIGSGETEWSGLLRFTMLHLRRITEKTDHRPYATAFGRLLSMDDFENFRGEDVDRDIFTEYKDDHRWGLTVGDALHTFPWLDTEHILGAAITLNEDFTADRITASATWRQLLGAVQAEAGLTYRYAFDDDDRDKNIDGFILRAELSYEAWIQDHERIELGFLLSHDFDADDQSVFATLTWHFGDGRGYRDFRPGEIHFRDRRHLRRPDRVNNRILYGE